MKEFMTEIVPWLVIIAALAAFAIVNAQEKANENSKYRKLHSIKGLCITLSTGAFLYIVLKWELWICIGCGILLGFGCFHFGTKRSDSEEQ